MFMAGRRGGLSGPRGIHLGGVVMAVLMQASAGSVRGQDVAGVLTRMREAAGTNVLANTAGDFLLKGKSNEHEAAGEFSLRFTAAGNTAGDFAFFQVSGTGSFNLFISDGIAGVTTGDVVVQLLGVTTINSIDLGSGDLTILT